MTLRESDLALIELEKKDFRKVLEWCFPNGNYINPRILNLCCGIANEESLLIEHFGRDTKILGIELEKSLRELSEYLGRKSVMTGDISQLEKYLSGEFDIIMGRNIPLNLQHNNWEKIRDIWPGVFEDIVKYRGVGSVLFLTLAREDEFFRAQEILNNVGYRLIVMETNPIFVHSDYIGIRGADRKDNYIILARRPVQLRLF